MEQLSGLDTLFTLNETRNTPMHIGALMLYEPCNGTRQPLRYEQVCQIFEDNLRKSPSFRRKLLPVPYMMDRPYWSDDRRFDLERHIEARDASGLRSPQDLWRLVGELHGRGLDMKRPLWHATFIENLGDIEGYPEGTTGLYIKVHHAAIDGMSGAAILAAIHNLTDESGPDAGQQEAWRAKRVAPSWWLAYKANSTRWIRNWRSAALAREVTRSVIRLRQHIGGANRDRPHSQWTSSPFNARVGAGRNIAVLSLPFIELRAVKRSLQRTTINHVALAIVGGALRRYLLEQDALPPVSLSTGMPIDVRDPKAKGGGNVLSATITTLRTDLENPMERLGAVRDAAIEARENAEVLGESTLLEMSSALSPRVSQTLLRILSAVGSLPWDKPMPINTVVSNVPGSPLDLYLGGARMRDMHAFGLLLDGVGLFHTATSYTDRFSITALGCPASLPDSGLYQDCLEQSWQELREAARTQSSTHRLVDPG